MLLALASLARALTTDPDFGRFLIRKEVWSANMSSAGQGTEISKIEYTWTFRGNDTFFSDALHRVSRSYGGPNQVDRWIGGTPVTRTTDVTFESATGLPVQVEVRGSTGELLQRWIYTRQ